MADAIRSARRASEEVLCATESLVVLSAGDIEQLKSLAASTARERSRLCVHKENENPVHEMFIVHSSEAYVRPHKHIGKPESFHVIEGRVDVVLYDDEANVTDVIRMGDYGSGLSFYYRIADATFHTLLIRSPILVFHETTSGPFDRSQTVLAAWAPEDSDRAGQQEFRSSLEQHVAAFFTSHP